MFESLPIVLAGEIKVIEYLVAARLRIVGRYAVGFQIGLVAAEPLPVFQS